MTMRNGKVVIGGLEFENPLDAPLSRRKGEYREWKEGERTSFRSIWLDRYVYGDGCVSFEASELSISNRGKCLLDGKELKGKEDTDTVKEIFNQIKLE